MDELITATDLDSWSRHRQAQGHLPSLVRAAIMATVAPASIRFPAAEGVGVPGFDGVVEVLGGVPPYVPDGRSVWEVGTGSDPAGKAADDYKKRTEQLPRQERERTTFVFVTSHLWGKAADWAERMADGDDGWLGVVALDADALALWLETLPGVRARFSEVLGRQPYRVTPLARWLEDWRDQTDPPLPMDLLLAGRLGEARDLAGALIDAAREHVVPAPSREEGVAFLAATLLASTLDAGAESGEDRQAGDPTESETVAAAQPVDASREATAERALVVHDDAAWRRCVTYDQPMILVPLFDDANVPAALRAGHHVVLARRSRAGDRALPPLDRLDARRAFEQQGLPFAEADELARRARRSLTSLRRRIGRGTLRQPEWATGAAAATLAPLLLAGAWRDDSDGDKEVVTALAGRAWREVVRDLAPLRAGDDAPVAEREHLWEFVDVVDAWDALQGTVSTDDLAAFGQSVESVLSETDPAAELAADERQRLAFSLDGLPRRRYSSSLRHGLADTLAVLGAVVGERPLAGGLTGQQHADRLVHRLLDEADAARWISLSDLLPLLAEAAPIFFLDAVEHSLARDDAPVLALFNEERDSLGLTGSIPHTRLLWALERLAFSPQLLSRVAVVLARLAEHDPGGRLTKRPAACLRDALHLRWPQSAATPSTRMAVLDRLRVVAPEPSWRLMVGLVRSLDNGPILNLGPARRDWIVQHRTSIDSRELTDSRNALAYRLADDAGTDTARWVELMDLIDRFPAAGRAGVLAAAARQWDAIPDNAAQVAKPLAERVAQHEAYPNARWTLPPEDLQRLRQFLSEHPPPDEQADRFSALFSCRPRVDGRELHREPEVLLQMQQEALRRLLADGLPAVLAFAAGIEFPRPVGAVLATVSTDHDEVLLEMLDGDDPAGQHVAEGLVRRRHLDDPAWLARCVADRPEHAVSMLLHVDGSSAVLDLVDGLAQDVQEDYWRRVSEWQFPDDAAARAAERLLDHDRPYSAIVVLYDVTGSRALPVELGVRVMRAPSQGTNEPPEVLGPSAAYLIGQALDSLENSGADVIDLVGLEWYYLPLLDDQHRPKALHRQLAQDPEFFSDMVYLAFRSDIALDGTGAGADENSPGVPQLAEVDEIPPHVSRAALSLLMEWRAPLPGASSTEHVPAVEDMMRWVAGAHAALAARDRAGAAPLALGWALSGPVTDADGTWPCLAVREVLEHEQNHVLEQELSVARFNQRGVTERSPYAGGSQERDLVAQYRRWADAVRDRWPRSGAVLDELARTYEIDARRADSSAARTSER